MEGRKNQQNANAILHICNRHDIYTNQTYIYIRHPEKTKEHFKHHSDSPATQLAVY